jgi:hypothetical protein
MHACRKDTAGIVAAASIGSVETIPALVEVINSSSEHETREAAIRALRVICAKQALAVHMDSAPRDVRHHLQSLAASLDRAADLFEAEEHTK